MNWIEEDLKRAGVSKFGETEGRRRMALSEIAFIKNLHVCDQLQALRGTLSARSTVSLKRRWYSKFIGHYDFGLLTTVLTLGGFDLHCAIPDS